MLTEIALTPHTFHPCTIDAKAWGGHLRALNQRLLHFGPQCPLIFSNLNDGSSAAEWLALISTVFARHKPNDYRAARDLFDRIKRDCLVSRPTLGRVRLPSDESQWVDEAVRPAPTYPIDQIVTSWQGLNACQKVFTKVIGLNSLDAAEFWSHVTTAASPGMDIKTQIKALRPLWLHGHLLAVVLPYGLESEADWFLELTRQAWARPAGYQRPRLELHVSSLKEDNDADIKSKGDKYWRVKNFLDRAARELPRGIEVDLYVRAGHHGSQRFISRRLFAGDEKDVGTGVPEIRVRWDFVGACGLSQRRTEPDATNFYALAS